MVLCPVKDVLNCATIMNGVQSAMTVGMQLMLELHVDRLDSLGQVTSLNLAWFLYESMQCYMPVTPSE